VGDRLAEIFQRNIDEADMKDSDARGLVLKRLYDLRHQIEHANVSDFAELPIDLKVLPNILSQLNEKGLIGWHPERTMAGGYLAFIARITAFGVDVVERTAISPIEITIDSSVNVHGSQNVIVGGSGNVQNVTMDFEKMINAVDDATVSERDKVEAKSVLQKLAESKLAQSIIRKFLLGA
jgi:hypothetical protein